MTEAVEARPAQQLGLRGAFQLLHPRLQEVIAAEGYVEPTPVQERAIPVILRGSHALVVAPTGSGKTEAALFPVFSKLLETGKPTGREREGLWAVYVTPLRSLNRDIFDRMARLAARTGIDLRVRHGDSTERDKREFLRSPPDVMVTTPESLYFLLAVKRFREIIRGLRFIVVDEVHELAESKRGAELAVALERLEAYAGRGVQRIGLSATLSDPLLAAKLLAGNRPVEVVDLSYLSKKMGLVVASPRPGREDEQLAKKLGLENTSTAARLRFIAGLVEEANGGVIVFTNTRDTSEVLGALLRQVLGEDRVLVHHGSLSREERLRAEQLFKTGRVKAIVATSSLELGIDIGHADLVVQYMSPRQATRLVQRVGRSRHRLGLESRGVVVAVDNLFDVLESGVIAARAMRGDLEPLEPYEKPFDALAHQLAGMVLEKRSVRLEDAYWVFRRTPYYEDLSVEELMAVAEYMDYARIVRIREGRLSRGRRIHSYYYSTTMIPDTKQYPVYDTVSGEKIGVLDEEFAATLEDGDVFVLGGRVWEVVTVEDNAVRVKPAETGELIPPAWEGDLIPVDWRVAREVGSILRRIEERGIHVLSFYPFDESARKVVEETVKAHLEKGLPLPSDKRVVVEATGRLAIVYAFLGTRGAKALELALSWVSHSVYGYTPRSSSTPYAVVLEYASPVDHRDVESLLSRLAGLDRETVESIVVEALKRTRLYEWKLFHVAKRMGAVDKDAKPDKRMLRNLVETVVGEEALRETLHDKIDFNALHRLLEGLRNGLVELTGYNVDEPSPLAMQVIRETRVGDRVAVDSLPPSMLVEIVKKRLLSRRVRLVCMMCGGVLEATIGELPEKPACPRCGSSYLAPTRLSQEEARRLVLKARRKERLSREERRVFKELMDAGDLVLTYGRRALEALAARGIGPSVARRVLSKLAIGGEELFYKAIVEEEQQYLRTRRYWKE